MFPRGGGVWDQDPELMRDFRIIRETEVQWKETQQQMESGGGSLPGGGGMGLEEALDEYVNSLEDDDVF